MVQRPSDFGLFEFAIVSGLRAAQLKLGCVPRVAGGHKMAVTAQMEVAGRHVVPSIKAADPAPVVA
jgi:DNA-directed RNA polymerase subunit K/omega